MNTGSLIAQSLLLTLELYRIHHNKSADWVPTQDDWDAFRAEVELYTAERFKQEARVSIQPPNISH